MSTILRVLSLLVLLVLSATPVAAAEYYVRPFLFDVVAEPRETVVRNVTLTNESDYRKYVVYATVNEISVDSVGEIKEFSSPVMVDRTNTVTSWIEVGRGRIEIPPNESLEVPVTFRINPQAQPGEYHAFVGFVPAEHRPQAEQIALDGQADGVVVKLTVPDHRQDNMKIISFKINRFITDDDEREVLVTIQNMGDIASAPSGELIFYDSRGREVVAEGFNEEGKMIMPGETVTLSGTVPVENILGKFKANLSLQYGENQRAALYDTTYFYMMPIYLLISVFLAVLILVSVSVLLIRRSFASADDYDEDGDSVILYVKQGHDPQPKDHDINLKNN